MTRRANLVLGLLFTTALTTPAFAGDHDPVVVESYESARPADAAALLAPIYAELAKRSYVGGDKLAESVRSRVSGDPGSLTPSQIVEAQQAVQRAYQRFVDGTYEEALALAEKALALYASAPGVLAREQALRGLEWKALLIAARSAQVLKRNDKAFSVMAEAIRSFPGQRPSAAEFDPSVIALYRQVDAELAKQGVGTLDVKVDDATAVIYVDEHFVGTGHALLDQLAPGRYRVFIAKGDLSGRVHSVDVAPGGKATLDVAWDLDGALSSGDGYVAVASRGDDISAASHVARALGAPRVVVLGVRVVNGRRAVVGYGVDVESQVRSYAAVQVEPLVPPEETMRRLAALLAGDEDVSTSDLITREPTTAAGTEGGGLGARRKIALVVAGAAVIAGGVAVGFDLSAHDAYDASMREPNNDKQDALFATSNSRYHNAQGLAVAGVVGIAAAATIWFTAPSRRESLDVAAVPSSTGFDVVVSGRF